MTAMPPPTTQPGGPATQGQMGAPTPAQPPAPTPDTPAQGLPPTGLQQQLQSLNQMYAQAQSVPGGVNVAQMQMSPTAQPLSVTPMQGGSTNVQQLAQSLAQSYGLAIGRGNIVDAAGNFLVTPDQMQSAGGGQDTIGETAAKMNYISQALARAKTEQQQTKATAALQTGLGQVQKRGRGSLAAMQSGFYQDLADLYSNQEYEAADFSYFIQKEQQDIARVIQRRQEKMAKKQARGAFIGGVIGGIASIATGNIAGIAASAGAIGGAAGGTGWF